MPYSLSPNPAITLFNDHPAQQLNSSKTIPKMAIACKKRPFFGLCLKKTILERLPKNQQTSHTNA